MPHTFAELGRMIRELERAKAAIEEQLNILRQQFLNAQVRESLRRDPQSDQPAR